MTDICYDLWEPIIGLEIHVQLNTRSKLFSSAPNRFGDEPNTNITPVCTGQPGALPVLNKEAVKKAVQFGLSVNATVASFSKFDRKSYFYPDSPRNFQITQYDQPLIIGGSIVTEVEGDSKEFFIERAHLEDDAGMLKHFSSFAGVDDNRAGAPLLEIVSKPCIHSAKEAVAYATTIKALMEYLDASDCNMEEGSLRIDVNVSVRLKGESHLRAKVEIKNMNSFANMELAIEQEIKRQIYLYSSEKQVERGTYRFDLEKRQTVLMRQKEEAEDYRYFPEPDLVPLVLSDAYISSLRAALPELPQQRLARYLQKLKLPRQSALLLVNDKQLADFFEEGLQECENAQLLCNWVTGEFVGRAKEQGKSVRELGIPSSHMTKLVNLIIQGKITGRIAKSVADVMIETPTKDPEKIVEENPDFQPLQDTSSIEPIVDQVLAENPQSAVDYKSGRTKAFAYLVGQVMKRTQGKASPEIVNALLLKKLQ